MHWSKKMKPLLHIGIAIVIEHFDMALIFDFDSDPDSDSDFAYPDKRKFGLLTEPSNVRRLPGCTPSFIGYGIHG
jgi:hypothetical protein